MNKSRNKKGRREVMKSLEEELVGDTKLPLYNFRTENTYFPVLGEGDVNAEIIFVGEAPGRKEALTGKPFCGASGRILDTLLTSVGLDRQSVYITSIVKDRPPENRDPTALEIESYSSYLDRQLEIIEPRVIATLGRFAMEYCLRHFGLEQALQPISEAHGKSFTAEAIWGKVMIVPLYHPAAAIYNQKLKETLKQDFRILKPYAKDKTKN